MKNKFLNLGFTLVELMVVISIIGILSAIVYANFSDSKKMARDQIRKTDLKDLQIAIQLYKAQNGTYPLACANQDAEVWSGNVNSGGSICANSNDGFIMGLVPDYIAKLPVDPYTISGSGCGYIYTTTGGGASPGLNYKLMAHCSVEINKIQFATDDFARCPAWIIDGSANWCDPSDVADNPLTTYAVYSAGAQNW